MYRCGRKAWPKCASSDLISANTTEPSDPWRAERTLPDSAMAVHREKGIAGR